MAMAIQLLALIAAVAFVPLCRALSMTVYKTECVSQEVEYESDLVSGNFVVVDHEIFWAADHPGIDLVVTSPAGNVVTSVKGSSGDKFQFRAPRRGLYKFCFHNPSSNPETVSFYIHVGHIPSEHELAKDEHLNPVNVRVAELREALESITAEQHYLKARAERHQNTNRSTQKRLLVYTLGEYAVLVAISVTQVYLIRSLFSKRIGYNKL